MLPAPPPPAAPSRKAARDPARAREPRRAVRGRHPAPRGPARPAHDAQQLRPRGHVGPPVPHALGPAPARARAGGPSPWAPWRWPGPCWARRPCRRRRPTGRTRAAPTAPAGVAGERVPGVAGPTVPAGAPSDLVALATTFPTPTPAGDPTPVPARTSPPSPPAARSPRPPPPAAPRPRRPPEPAPSPGTRRRDPVDRVARATRAVPHPGTAGCPGAGAAGRATGAATGRDGGGTTTVELPELRAPDAVPAAPAVRPGAVAVEPGAVTVHRPVRVHRAGATRPRRGGRGAGPGARGGDRDVGRPRGPVVGGRGRDPRAGRRGGRSWTRPTSPRPPSSCACPWSGGVTAAPPQPRRGVISPTAARPPRAPGPRVRGLPLHG
jgi:hypothetical protein